MFTKGQSGNPRGSNPRNNARRAVNQETANCVKALASIRDDAQQPAALRMNATCAILALADPTFAQFVAAQAAQPAIAA